MTTAKDLELAMVNVVTDAPGGTLFLRYAFKEGRIVSDKRGPNQHGGFSE